ncbi:MAG: segregation/condensation protein A [Lachnospiraceae bacterium]|nr:segregation/condensation protein A [Lachnospiraceae bacterium]
MAISVKLEKFEGPLDLLLHLIEKNKIDIYDIPIVEITDQYLDYIHTMDHEDLDVVSEFLVMAATLLDIKCKMLLPREVDEEGEELDPRAELVQRLLEYKLYKYMSLELKDRELTAGQAVYRGERLPEEVKAFKAPVNYEELIGDMNLKKLYAMFEQLLKRQQDKVDPIRSQYGDIKKEAVDAEKKAEYVEHFILSHRHFSFRELLERQTSREEIVVTFLVLLELIKMGKVTVEQDGIFDDIHITSQETFEDEEAIEGISENENKDGDSGESKTADSGDEQEETYLTEEESMPEN